MSRERFLAFVTGRQPDPKGTGPYAMMRWFAAARGIPMPDLIGPSRARPLAHQRQDCMALLRRQYGLSYPEIGKMFGDRDHTTVMHGLKASNRREME